MRKLLTAPTLAALALLVACADVGDSPTAPTNEPVDPADAAGQAQRLGYVPGQILVRFREGAPMEELARAEGAEIERALIQGTRVLDVPLGREREIIDELRDNPFVEYAEPDYIYTVDVPCGTGECVAPTDAFFGYRWDQHNDGTITDSQGVDLAATGLIGADMDWLEAFDAMGAVPGSAVVGIIDTGILDTHEDLAGKVLPGFDFFDNDPDPADDHGHGTHVAGIAAAHGNNGTGVPGVAWIPEVEIRALKVCGYLFGGFFHGCPSSAIASGITWAVDNGVDVINLSLGGGPGSAEVQAALQYARANDVLPICAAGNDSGPVSFPGAFPECVAISSTDWGDGLASYSNFGPEVQLSAPGGDFEDPNAYSQILSAYYTGNDQYAWLPGTSMASPQAAGLASLLHALGVTDDDEKVTRMQATADDLGAPGQDDLYGAGRINIYSAVLDLVGGPTNRAPTASFTTVCTDLTCDFTDASSDLDGFVVTWDWDFGDGNTSVAQNPTHTFAVAGTYTVTLTVTDDMGATGSLSDAVTVPTPNAPPTSSFTSSCTDLDCVFTDASSDSDGTLVSWGWDFGDGNTSTEQNPTYSYAAGGTYTVTLTVTDDDGAIAASSADVTVEGPNQPPTASFTSACTDLTCAFTDTSTDPDGTVDVHQWNFGDGWSSNAPSPSHTYGAPGTYAVTLEVFDDDGASGTFSDSVMVTVNQAPTASFAFACTDLTCDFTDASTDPDGTVASWDWDLGDGNTSTEQNPTHAFAVAGTYTVTLTVTDDGGAQASFGTDVTVPTPNAPPTALFTSSCTDLDCVFTDASIDGDGSVVAWDWDFGDGNASTEQNPTYSYAAGGTFTVTLTVTDDGGATGVSSAAVTVEGPNQPPTASFTSACTDFTCSFTDTSTDPDGTIDVHQWNFGDGWSSSAPSPTHTYGNAGTYTVTLEIFDDDGASDTFSMDVTVVDPNQPPTAAFSSICTELSCDFTDQTIDTDGLVTTWSWDFGDGNTSTEQNPSHMYAAAGTYTVTLMATDDMGATGSFSDAVTVAPSNVAPTASFTSSCTDLDCVFTDASSDSDGTLVSWGWDFGDGSTSTEQNPTYSYAAGGTYTVTLTVTDDDGATAAFSGPVTVAPPNVAPTASFTSACTDFTCSFTDTSTDPDGTIDVHQWNFGDGWSSSAPSPTHTYGNAGTYTVTLEIFDDDGASDTFSMDVTVVDPNQPPTAAFSSICTELSCDFTDQTIDTDGLVTTWSWDFGDGNTSTEQNPSHMYAAAGTYTVTLMATDDMGATGSFSDAVTVAPSNVAPTASFTSSCTDLDCVFTDASSDSDGTLVSWGWDFGDGSTSTEQNPTYSYAAGGTYTVTLTVTDDDGATAAFSGPVTVAPPNVAPTASFTSACTDFTCSFTDTSTDPDGTIDVHQWNFGDGWSSSAPNPTHTYGNAGTYTVTLEIFDDDGASDTFSMNVTVVDPPSFVGEVGSLSVTQANASQWHTVALGESYTDPVVVMGPLSFNGGQPTTLRVRNVTSTTFQFQVDEWDYLDGGHIAETVSYLVMEAGVQQLANGVRIEAGRATVGTGWSTISLSSFTGAPVVLSQVASTNEASAVTTRQRNVSASTFQVQIEEEEAGGSHVPEDVHWIAIEQGTVTGQMEASTTPDQVRHTWYSASFSQGYAAPVFLGAMQSTDGGDSATLRYRNLGASGVQVHVDEEQSANSEVNHTTEVVGFVIFEGAGPLLGGE